MATRYSYPIDFHKEREGGFSVTFPDFDEAFTDGDTLAEAVAKATDYLEEALAGRIAQREDIPTPSPARGRPTAVPGAVLAAKTALFTFSFAVSALGACVATVSPATTTHLTALAIGGHPMPRPCADRSTASPPIGSRGAG